MPRIRLAEAFIQIDGQPIAEAFAISITEFEKGIGDGSIVRHTTEDHDPKAGEVELVFVSADRQVRVIITRDGAILSCLEEPVASGQGVAPGAGEQDAKAGKQGRAEKGRAEGTTPAQKPKADAARHAHLDQLLDEALADSFPASDPITIISD